MQSEKTMTIFTPTYNRAHILQRVYNSLCVQTDLDFEWLIVDDGSEDDTEHLVKEWIEQNVIPIRYYKQENGGKQRAHNKGVEMSNTELFVCLDSDDYVTRDFVEQHIKKWNEVKNDTTIAGIVSLKGYESGKPTGTSIPENLEKTTLMNLYKKLKFRGDATMMYRTELLKAFLFVVEPDEKFIGEEYVYNQIDRKYQMAVLPKVLMIVEYLEDGYSRNVRRVTKENPKGYMRLKKQSIEYAETWFERYIQTILYLVGCRLSGENNPLKNLPYKFLGIVAYLPAWLAWVVFYKDA